MPLTTEQLDLVVDSSDLIPAAQVPSKALSTGLDDLLVMVRDLDLANAAMLRAHHKGDDVALAKAAGEVKGLVRRVQRKVAEIQPHVTTLTGLLGEQTMTMLGQVLALAVTLVPDPIPAPPPAPMPAEPEPEPAP
jgi:hypothetical protein